jgi:ABC-type uncharacterized transport system ATPase subunit
MCASARSGQCTVLMITHKFREVMAYADDVTVLRRGKAGAPLRWPRPPTRSCWRRRWWARRATAAARRRRPCAPKSRANAGAVRAHVCGLQVMGDRGTLAVQGSDLQVRAGEIVGVAGVSGNGQRELVEALVGQRPRLAGRCGQWASPMPPPAKQNRRLKVRSLPEEPLRNACVGDLSVAENMACATSTSRPAAPRGPGCALAPGAPRPQPGSPTTASRPRAKARRSAALSGGNVQRAVLARELAGDADVLLAANPVFGLDFAAVAEIHGRLQVRATAAPRCCWSAKTWTNCWSWPTASW